MGLGGMSSLTVLSGFFAGISGSAAVEASTLGSILIPAMKTRGIWPQSSHRHGHAPVGILLFIVRAASGERLTPVTKEALPLIGICLIVLFLVASIPAISLVLPQAKIPV